MKKISNNFKIFLTALLISVPFWWSANVLNKNLEEIFFWREIEKNPQIFLLLDNGGLTNNLTARLTQPIVEKKPEGLDFDQGQPTEPLEIQAESAISLKVTQNEEKILFEKNSGKILPIASLTKLFTAYVILENYDLEQVVEISEKAVSQTGDAGGLRVGEKLRVEDLLYISLMDSSNDAAYALAELIGQQAVIKSENGTEPFVSLMNMEIEKKLGLKNTKFLNPTGLEPDDPDVPKNFSTCRDLAEFTTELIKKPLILEILSLPEFELRSLDGISHKLKNTNELLKMKTSEEDQRPKWASEIIGGKTGWTPEAKGCLLLILKTRKDGYLINVILGSGDRFGEMRKLIDWAYNY